MRLSILRLIGNRSVFSLVCFHSLIDLMSYEQDTKEFEAVDLGFAWFDEPPPESIYKATVARMRRGGIIFITATPLTGSAWLYDHIVAFYGKALITPTP